jgi:hypothetical protein
VTYITAEIRADDLPHLGLRLVPVVTETPGTPAGLIQAYLGDVCVWLHASDVARLLFDGQAERLAFYGRAVAVSRAVHACEPYEVFP